MKKHKCSRGESQQINNVIRLDESLKYDGQHEQALNKFDEAIELCTNNTNFLDFTVQQHKESAYYKQD
ncbi:hypothetical protein OR571_01140 [Psychrobacillus sp. NEAU-3TGS]|uniref:hypothetical protein n=1 Tax=Psychrobacillus sp. NEAU-3TGS TaxID=2995412 RepID=UPI002496545C|nr:hypothetical protein [Psychrobacillus sp. NEAU-3TGS]MDI2585771.1 hypothetical protein [Psychrobacillus sp. NEAU-3TGS]